LEVEVTEAERAGLVKQGCNKRFGQRRVFLVHANEGGEAEVEAEERVERVAVEKGAFCHLEEVGTGRTEIESENGGSLPEVTKAAGEEGGARGELGGKEGDDVEEEVLGQVGEAIQLSGRRGTLMLMLMLMLHGGRRRREKERWMVGVCL
jgi:hypothetical protein